MHPYIAPGIWVFSGQSFPLTCVCLVAPCLSPPGFPWDCQETSAMFSWLIVQSFCKVLESFTIKTNLSTQKKKPGNFSHIYELKQLCFRPVIQAQLLRILIQDFKIYTHLVASRTPLKPLFLWQWLLYTQVSVSIFKLATKSIAEWPEARNFLNSQHPRHIKIKVVKTPKMSSPLF